MLSTAQPEDKEAFYSPVCKEAFHSPATADKEVYVIKRHSDKEVHSPATEDKEVHSPATEDKEAFYKPATEDVQPSQRINRCVCDKEAFYSSVCDVQPSDKEALYSPVCAM